MLISTLSPSPHLAVIVSLILSLGEGRQFVLAIMVILNLALPTLSLVPSVLVGNTLWQVILAAHRVQPTPTQIVLDHLVAQFAQLHRPLQWDLQHANVMQGMLHQPMADPYHVPFVQEVHTVIKDRHHALRVQSIRMVQLRE